MTDRNNAESKQTKLIQQYTISFARRCKGEISKQNRELKCWTGFYSNSQRLDKTETSILYFAFEGKAYLKYYFIICILAFNID